MRLCEESHILYPLGIATIGVLAFFPRSVRRGGTRLTMACGRGTAVPSGRLSGRGNALREADHGFQPRHSGAIRHTVRTRECAARGWPRLPAAARQSHPEDCLDGGMRCARLTTAYSRGTAVPSGGQSGRQEGGQSGIFKFENLKIKAADFPCFQIYM